MSEEIEFHVKQEMIAPFWQKLPFFLLFPFRTGPLIFLICITGVSVLAGVAMGAAGLLFKGTLLYFGLRYAFNVLDLFSQGRFESESPDNSLFGPEKRPAKFGLVIALFLVIGTTLGGALVTSRIATDKRVQAQLIERYQRDHAAEMEKLAKEEEAFNKRLGIDTSPSPLANEPADEAVEDTTDQGAADGLAVAPEQEPEPAVSAVAHGPDTAEILSLYHPEVSDPLWFKLLPGWYWLVMILLSLMLPAAVIVIALEDKFFKALNPAHIVFLGKSMGSAYLVLWAFFLLIAGSRLLAVSAGSNWPMFVRFPVETGVATYLGIVLFAMIGYALYQYHQELGLEVAVDFDSHRTAGGVEGIAAAGSTSAALRQNQPQDPLERKVQALLADGKVEGAIAEIKDYMRYDRFDPDLNTRLHPLYAQLGDQAATLAQGQQWIAALVRADRHQEAFAALQKLLAIAPEFTVEDSDALLPLAQSAVQRREYGVALKLIRGFDKRFPKHKDTAAVFFLGAKITSEYLRKHDDAIKILRTVLRVFPDDVVVEEAKTYLAVLEKIVAKP